MSSSAGEAPAVSPPCPVRWLVQHHPSRVHLLGPLLEQIPDAEVVTDPDPEGLPSAWRTYRACLEATAGATHVVIVQDDAAPHPGFVTAAEAALAARPGDLVAFFVASQSADQARAIRAAGSEGGRFCPLNRIRWVPTVALGWPVELIPPVLAWIDSQRWTDRFAADDERLGRAVRALGLPVIATIPCLVEHPDLEVSIMRPRRGHRLPSRSRLAACPPEEGCDLAGLEWDA